MHIHKASNKVANQQNPVYLYRNIISTQRRDANMKKGNTWAYLLKAHRTKVRINQDDFAKSLWISQALVSRYERGKTIPPLELLSDMCVILDLTGEERSSFVEEAYLTHAPDRVRSIVTDLRAEVARARRLIAKYDAQFPGLK